MVRYVDNKSCHVISLHLVMGNVWSQATILEGACLKEIIEGKKRGIDDSEEGIFWRNILLGWKYYEGEKDNVKNLV